MCSAARRSASPVRRVVGAGEAAGRRVSVHCRRLSRQRRADPVAQLHGDRRRPAHGQRFAGHPLQPPSATLARLSQPPAGWRHHVPHHRRQLCRADDADERIAADPVGDDPARRDVACAVPARSRADRAGADRGARAVRADLAVQPQDRLCRRRGARAREPGLLAGAVGHGGDQGRPGLRQGRGGAPALYGREPREPARDLAALYLADALFRRGQPGHRGRHGDRHLCRRAGGDDGAAHGRATRRLYLVPGAALYADQSDHAELGPYRRRAHRRPPGL